MQEAENKKLTRLEAFELIVSVYQEKSSASGGIPAMQYDQGNQQGKATNTGNSQLVKPSDSDFVCDVELAAIRCLKPGDLVYWRHYYKTSVVVVAPEDKTLLAEHVETFPEHLREAVASIDHRMRTTLGEELLRSAIAPMNRYLKPVDVRGPRRAKNRWSHLYGN